MTQISLNKFPLHEADRCVMCGLCLPHCPTYKLYNTESESPRGRIALMRALAMGEITSTLQLKAHLDHCLVCGACEDVCPAGVPYGSLIDTTRALANSTPDTTKYQYVHPAETLANFARIESWSPLLRFYQRSGLQKVVRTIRFPQMSGLQQLERLLPKLSSRCSWQEYYPASEKQRGQVALFFGCTGKALDGDTVAATITILTRLGYSVELPPDQGCCGALHQHNGFPDEARKMALNNLNMFQADRLDAIIYIASGCGAQLVEYEKLTTLNQKQHKQAQIFSGKVQEISQFISTVAWPDNMMLAPLEKKLVIHIPCSLRHILHRQQKICSVLKKIPRLTIINFPDNGHCCGAAGDYMLRYSSIANALLKPGLDALEQLQPDLIASANIGCALHIMAGLRERNLNIEVVHPVALVAQQIIVKDGAGNNLLSSG